MRDERDTMMRRRSLPRLLRLPRTQLATLQSQLKTLKDAIGGRKEGQRSAAKGQSSFECVEGIRKASGDHQARTLLPRKRTVEEHQTKTDELAKRISENERVLTQLQGKRLGVADMVAEARGAVSVFRAQQRRETARRDDLERRIASAEEMLDFLRLVESTKSSRKRGDLHLPPKSERLSRIYPG